MNRAPIVLAATAAGLAATLAFHPHAQAQVASTPAPAVTAPTSTSTTKTKTKTSKTKTKTATGAAVPNQYGNVQLKVTISGGKITGIEPVQLPAADPKSAAISSYAAPLLRQSALSAQSANIDVVSGATYTSDGYRTALQSALDKAGLSSPAPAS
jgi:uncharacterized protein with FMN-binding domain